MDRPDDLPAILIDGKRHDVLGYGREYDGWIELLVRPEGSDTLKSEAEVHILPRHWLDGLRGISHYSGGRVYRAPRPKLKPKLKLEVPA